MEPDIFSKLKEAELLIQAMGYCGNTKRYGKILKLAKEVLDSIEIDNSGKEIWLKTKLPNFGEQQTYIRTDIDIKLREMLENSAQLGCKEAKYDFGCILYEEGQFDLALELIRQSALLGYAPAQWTFGLNCLNGIYIKKDISKAEYYMNLSAEQGYLQAIEFLYKSYKNGTNSFCMDKEKSDKWENILSQTEG